MINIVKSSPAPPCLEIEKQKTNGNYKCGEVLKRTKEDFKNKCYLCESKEPISINIEHFIPHKGNKDKKFDWYNLFWACAHCNNTKLDKYDTILNPIDPEQNVEDWIKYHMLPFPNEKVKLTAIDDSKKVQHTIQLLNEVYNGTTPLKVIESDNLRKTLLKELLNFQASLLIYYEEDSEPADREYHLKNIERHLKRSSAFTAFKRWVVKENPIFKEELEQYFD